MLVNVHRVQCSRSTSTGATFLMWFIGATCDLPSYAELLLIQANDDRIRLAPLTCNIPIYTFAYYHIFMYIIYGMYNSIRILSQLPHFYFLFYPIFLVIKSFSTRNRPYMFLLCNNNILI